MFYFRYCNMQIELKKILLGFRSYFKVCLFVCRSRRFIGVQRSFIKVVVSYSLCIYLLRRRYCLRYTVYLVCGDFYYFLGSSRFLLLVVSQCRVSEDRVGFFFFSFEYSIDFCVFNGINIRWFYLFLVKIFLFQRISDGDGLLRLGCFQLRQLSRVFGLS